MSYPPQTQAQIIKTCGTAAGFFTPPKITGWLEQSRAKQLLPQSGIQELRETVQQMGVDMVCYGITTIRFDTSWFMKTLSTILDQTKKILEHSLSIKSLRTTSAHYKHWLMIKSSK